MIIPSGSLHSAISHKRKCRDELAQYVLHSFLYEQSGAHHTTLLSLSTYATVVSGYFLNLKL